MAAAGHLVVKYQYGSPEDLRVLYEEIGLCLREITELTGVPYSTARHRLRTIGVKPRKRGGGVQKLAHSELAKTAFLYERMGWSCNEIAEALGLHTRTVGERLQRHGVEMRSRGESTRLRFARRGRKTPTSSEAQKT
jgi:hypothetical protein